MSDVMATIDVMPITTPSTVKPERLLLVRTVSNAITTTSPMSPARILLLTAKGLNRIESRGAARGVHSKKQPDQRGNADSDCDRPHLDGCRNRREFRDDDGDDRAEKCADDPAEHREHHRLGEHLHHDVAATRAQSFAQAYLAHALAHHHKHSVPDH